MEKYVKALKEVEGVFKNTPAEFSYFLGEDYNHYLIEVILKDGTGVLTIKQLYYIPSELHVTCIIANPYDKEASYVKLIDIASKIAEYTRKPYCKLIIPVENNAILCKTLKNSGFEEEYREFVDDPQREFFKTFTRSILKQNNENDSKFIRKDILRNIILYFLEKTISQPNYFQELVDILRDNSELNDSDCISINKTLLDCVINHCEAMQNYDKLSKYGDFYYKIKNL